MRMPVPPVFCDLLIVDGAKGPLGGHCPFVSGNPLVPYHQFAWFTDRKITWGYKAPGIGTAPSGNMTPHMLYSHSQCGPA